MDEMKLKLSSKFMRSIISKLIMKAVYNKFGVKADFNINELVVELSNGKLNFHINADGSVDEKAFLKIKQLVDSDED